MASYRFSTEYVTGPGRWARMLAFRGKTLVWVAVLPAIAVASWRATAWRLHAVGVVAGGCWLALLYAVWRMRRYEASLVVTVTPEVVCQQVDGVRDRRIAREDAIGFTTRTNGLAIRTALSPRIGPLIFVPREVAGYPDLSADLVRIGINPLAEVSRIPSVACLALAAFGMGLMLLGASAPWVDCGALLFAAAIGWQFQLARGKPGRAMTSLWAMAFVVNLPLLFTVNHLPPAATDITLAVLILFSSCKWWRQRTHRMAKVA